MRLGRLLSAEGALVLGGLGIAGTGAGVDIWATAAGLVGGGASAHDELLAFNMPIVGLAFIAFGLFMAQSSLFLRKGYRRVFLASVLLAADGLVHMAAIPSHLAEPHQAAFFAAVAAIQVPAGLALPESTRRLRDLWLSFSLALIGIYIASRTTDVPFLFSFEPVEGLGVASKILEGVLVLVLLSMRAAPFDEGLRAAAVAAQGRPEPASNASR